MNQADQPESSENPFCSRRVRPGGIPYLFAPGESAAELVDRLRDSGWWGQIVGPHGSGKSALLAALMPAIEAAGRRTVLIELHDGQRQMPPDFRRRLDAGCPTVLIVDGYEQLSLWQRLRLRRFCRRGGMGLLLTAHAPVGLPDLCHTSVTPELAQQIVERLQRGHPPRIAAADVAERFACQSGDLRETLFDLYDLYEERRGGA